MAMIDTSIYNQTTTPDIVGSYMKGNTFRQMLDQQNTQKNIKSC